MPRYALVILAALAAVLTAAAPARAAGFWDWVHHPIVYTEDYYRWPTENFMPYLENSKQAQDHQWDGKHWQPDDWIRQNKDGLTLVKKFYTADIIRRQYVHKQTYVLVVGPAFYQLGGEDKRRTMAVVDTVWKVTSGKPGFFMLYDWDSGKAVGTYTKDGLQIQ